MNPFESIKESELSYTPNSDFGKIDLEAAMTEVFPNGWRVLGGLEGLQSTLANPSLFPTTNPNADRVLEAATNGAADYTTHRIPEGAETLSEALADLPNDLGELFTDWLDGFDLTGLLASLVNVLSGGLLQWVMVGFLGLKMINMGRELMAPGQRVRGPVSLVYYQVPAPTVPPVVAYLQNSEQVEVRETVPDGQYTRIGVPVYHSGRADRGFAHLQQRTGLEYTRI